MKKRVIYLALAMVSAFLLSVLGCENSSMPQPSSVNLESSALTKSGQSGVDIRMKSIFVEKTSLEKLLDNSGSESTKRIEKDVLGEVEKFINAGNNDIVKIEYFRDNRGLIRGAQVFYRIKK